MFLPMLEGSRMLSRRGFLRLTSLTGVSAAVAACTPPSPSQPRPPAEKTKTPEIILFNYYSGTDAQGNLVLSQAQVKNGTIFATIAPNYDWASPVMSPYQKQLTELLSLPNVSNDLEKELENSRKRVILTPSNKDAQTSCDILNQPVIGGCVTGIPPHIIVNRGAENLLPYVFTHETVHWIIGLGSPKNNNTNEITTLGNTQIKKIDANYHIPTLYIPTTITEQDFNNQFAQAPFRNDSDQATAEKSGAIQNSLAIDGRNAKGYFILSSDIVGEVAASLFEGLDSEENAYTQGLDEYSAMKKTLSSNRALKGLLLEALYRFDGIEVLKCMTMAHYGVDITTRMGLNEIIQLGAQDLIKMVAYAEFGKYGIGKNMGDYFHYVEKP